MLHYPSSFLFLASEEIWWSILAWTLFLANVLSIRKYLGKVGFLKFETHYVLYYFFVGWCLTSCFLESGRTMGRLEPRLCPCASVGRGGEEVGGRSRQEVLYPRFMWHHAHITYLVLFHLYNSLTDLGIIILVLQIKRPRKVQWLAKTM